MQIKNMFRDDINRNINGVVQVEQEEKDVVYQEIKEYVVTSELKKHFVTFFDAYSDSFIHPTDNVGVWITGFFGSGKSHFLKMLSYLLSNKTVNGKPTIEYFRDKFDDELTFMNVEKSTSVLTETILFNIDVEGSINKDDTAVLRVFATVFYNHLGFYGKDLKVASLEKFISKQGKYDEFKRVFEEINGESWEETRNTMAFFEDDVVETMVKVLGISETAARNWFNGTEEVDLSVGQLVDEIKEYVGSKPEGFRLLFMIDEAGQYIGTNTSMLLNLQSLIEKLGSVCRGQVWIVATGQEALDDMIKVRQDEFSRIMARFKVRLSLTSSSVGEVIEKRLLTKTNEAEKTLKLVYDNNNSVLRNLYSFDTENKDICGYSTEAQFIRVFPFVPYQFILMQKVFNEIRKHGHAGKHQSSGERSMLNGFQESAQKVQDRNELSLVPLYEFYDTLHSFLDTAVRSVIERAERAADNNQGLTKEDVKLLKLLYLIRYIDDVKSNIENLTILMADTITVDKLELKNAVKESLERLVRQNYVARNGDIYTFLTDEEQDITREIKNTPVDTSSIISKIGDMIFSDIYQNKKYRYGKYDFSFDERVDGLNIGNTGSDMCLRFMTVAADASDLQDLKLITDSKNDEAICVLSSAYPYFESIELALKIRKYIKQKNVSQLPDTIQKIITDRQREASNLEAQARDELSKSIVEGKYYISGEVVNLQGNDAKTKINKALEYLVEQTYKYLNMIETNAQSDSDILSILRGTNQQKMDGTYDNQDALNEVENYLKYQAQMKLPTSMADLQNRYSNAPYGWRDLDIASVIAQLVANQKVTVKVAGMTITKEDSRLVGYLYKKSETGKVMISIREEIPSFKLKQVKDLLREYFDVMDLPNDEDGLFEFISDNFGDQRSHYMNYQREYAQHNYPGKAIVDTAVRLIDDIHLHSSDNIALVDYLIDIQDDLLDSKEDMADVENFFATQKTIFDNGLNFVDSVKYEGDYFIGLDEVQNAVEEIKKITTPSNAYNYSRIKDINNYISIIKDARDELLKNKRAEISSLIDQCMHQLEEKAKDKPELLNALNSAKRSFDERRNEVLRLESLTALDSKVLTLTSLRDRYLDQMDQMLNPKKEDNPVPSPLTPLKPKKKREFYMNAIFPRKTLKSKDDVESYVEDIRKMLLGYLSDVDELDIK